MDTDLGPVPGKLLVRIIPAMSPTDTMSQIEVDKFLLESRIPLKLGTIDQHGDPIIHPIWYHYDEGKFYLITASNSRKMQNASRHRIVYFCVDTETRPYKGVKGKGTLSTIKDRERTVRMGERIISKYLGNSENPLGKYLIKRLKTGEEALVQITPHYFSVWDDSKST